MPISYTQSNFREKQHINGHNPAKQAYKIWRKNFKGLLIYHILGVGSFFSRTLYTCVIGYQTALIMPKIGTYVFQIVLGVQHLALLLLDKKTTTKYYIIMLSVSV